MTLSVFRPELDDDLVVADRTRRLAKP